MCVIIHGDSIFIYSPEQELITFMQRGQEDQGPPSSNRVDKAGTRKRS